MAQMDDQLQRAVSKSGASRVISGKRFLLTAEGRHACHFLRSLVRFSAVSVDGNP